MKLSEMPRFLPILFFLFISPFARSQECGTEPNKEQIEFANSLAANGSLLRIQETYLAKIPLKIHIVRKSDGTGGLTDSQLTNALKRVNDLYKHSNLEFFISGSINYIDSDVYYDFKAENEENIGGANDLPKAINVYFFNSLTSGSPLCGYTYLPPSADRIMLSNDCISSGDTFAHEIGHYFSLFHTHGKTNTGTTDELVDGSNCQNAGDNICDTPADPNLSGKVNSSCQYTGTLRDSNGDTYSPMVTNIMAYSGSCREFFTPGQYDRVRQSFEAHRNYLNFVVDGFRALFSTETRIACVGSTIKFEAQTNAAQKWRWEFPGGTPSTSSFENPSITYNTPGIYSVTLQVEGGGGLTDNITKNALIKIENPLAEAREEPLNESFNSEVLPPIWEIENNDYGLTFEISTIDEDGESISNSLFMNNYEYYSEQPSNTDIFISPNFSTTGVKSFTMTFDYAYTFYPSRFSDTGLISERADTLKVGLNSSCINNFDVLWSKGGANLATAPASEDPFIPTILQWKKVSINIPVTNISEGFVNIGIINESYNGNNLYIDNLEILIDESVDSPLNFRRSNTGNGLVNLRWIDNSSNELQYIIERAINDGEFEKYDSVGMNSTLYEDMEIIGENIYRYRIYAQGRENNRSEYSQEVEISFITAVDRIIEEVAKSHLLYPNPSSGVITIAGMENSDQVKEIRIINLQGNLIFSTSFNPGNEHILSVGHLAKGVYIVELRTVENNKYQYRIIKK